MSPFAEVDLNDQLNYGYSFSSTAAQFLILRRGRFRASSTTSLRTTAPRPPRPPLRDRALNTGVILHVQPHVNYNGSVLLNIDQLISTVPQNNTSFTPTISQREVKSSISVVSGQTVLLAGMIQDQ